MSHSFFDKVYSDWTGNFCKGAQKPSRYQDY